MKPAKLHYFKGRGRAETTRWMLAASDIEFVNISLEDHTDFDALKLSRKLPFNQLPLLEIGDLKLSQSSALISFLARSGNLYGSSEEEAVWCDMLIGAVNDFNTPAMQFAFKQDKREASKDLDSSLIKFGNHFEFRLTQNGGKFLIGKRLSSADIILAEALTSFIEFAPDCLESYPYLMEFQNRIVSLPNIKNYLKSAKRWRLPDEQYVIDVARVLRRPLPPHFVEPDRFVQKLEN